MTLRVLCQQFAGGIEMRVLADAGENIDDLTAIGLCVLHPICRQDRQSIMSRQIDKFGVQAFFAPQKMSLDFNEDVFPTKNIDQKLRAICNILGSTGCWP